MPELVDNAVDACGAFASNDDADRERNDGDGTGGDETNEGRTATTTRRRVRVTITPATLSSFVSTGGSDDDDDDDGDGGGDGDSEGGRHLLRVEVSDNGCGMSDIDYCVSAFGSNKNGKTTTTTTTTRGRGIDDIGEGRRGSGMVGTAAEDSAGIPSTEDDARGGGSNRKDQKSSSTLPTASSDDVIEVNDGCTSGRYGVGLTLCLLHAQRLVPGTGACVTSATERDSSWVRATYEPDADRDVIVCRKRERFPKMQGESGTTISLMVPGGDNARRAWPRLAEYFARFQLVINLPCSLEVKAPSLQSMPLYIRPPGETEHRQINRTTGGDDENSNDGGNWDGGDGCDEGSSLDHDEDIHRAPKVSKAAHQRAEAEVQKKAKISLMFQAAIAYKCRPDLKVENVAHTVQPIRRDYNRPRKSTPSLNGPVLEMSLIVFGPDLSDAEDHSDGAESGSYSRGRVENYRSKKKSSSKLQIVRIVNGIPILDSSEALACGVINNVSSSSDTWTSFGLNVSRNSEDDEGVVHPNDLYTPTFVVNDSAQVAPFLKDTTHSLFRDQRRDWDQSSNDDDEFDTENTRGKRKKMRQMKCLLPAALRLGDILMVVQIRAKPSALPLPTLSKGRLPLHDKSISDALEIGIADCLRSLQRSSPGLLLTAQQLKGIERDVKYIPAATCAITSILCRSTRSTVYDNAMNIMSSWDDQVKRMRMKYGVELGAASRTVQSHARDEDLRFDALRSILERRLRFIVSDEFKDAKKTSEKEQQKRDREGSAAAKKMINAIHGMKSDCFDSDDSDHSTLAESARHERQLHSTRYHSRSSIRFQHSRRRQNGAPLSPTSSVTVAAGLEQILYAESHHGHQISSRNDRSGTGAKSNQPSCKNFNECVSSELRLTGSPVNNFDDGYESSPKLPIGQSHNARADSHVMHPRMDFSVKKGGLHLIARASLKYMMTPCQAIVTGHPNMEK
ncbi:hypothetical protein ACHAXA_010296 [Cyclostephanos tholiformis]|uniref:Uncharacterized protein n=1 Tax=Cyclostephanos tholiformis TaxID=382380 RepID=A0ABD3RER0_9STRA